jgi:hypothetical protein
MYVRGNPVMLIDSNGMNDHEYEFNEKTGETKYISDLGGENVDFIHYTGGGEHSGQTEIVNQCENKSVFMKTSEYIKGYSRRNENTNWKTIFNEWSNGKGPEKSLIYGKEHQMNIDLLNSYQVNMAYENYIQNGENLKYSFGGDFGILGAIRAGTNMTEQMVGSASVSVYPIGNLLVIAIMDSKSISSWTPQWWDGDEVNTSRTNATSVPKSTTYQTYLIIIERSKMKRINSIYNEIHLPD